MKKAYRKPTKKQAAKALEAERKKTVAALKQAARRYQRLMKDYVDLLQAPITP